MEIGIDINLMATIALGVFIALIARDLFNALVGAFLGFGVVSSSKQSETCTVKKVGPVHGTAKNVHAASH